MGAVVLVQVVSVVIGVFVVILAVVVFVAVGAEYEKSALSFTKLIVGVEGRLIRYAVLGSHIDIELELSDETLLVPQPKDETIIGLTRLK